MAAGTALRRPEVGYAASRVLSAPPAAFVRAVQVIWDRPSILAALTLVAVCVPAGTGADTEGLSITPGDVTASVLVVLVAVRLAIRGSTVSLGRPVVLAAAAVLAAQCVAALSATDHDASLVGFVRYAEVFVIVPVAVALTLERRSDLVTVLAAVIGVGLVEGAVGTYQYITGTGASIGDASVRAVGTFDAYDIMSMAIVVSWAWLAALAVGLGARGRLARAGLLSAAVLSVPMILSLSRGAWLAALVNGLIIACLAGWRRAFAGIAIAGLILVIVLGVVRADLGVVGARASSVLTVANAPDRSVNDRYDMWTAALHMWQDQPLTGVGPKNFALWRDTYAPLSLSSGSDISSSATDFDRVELLSPHNVYLLIGSEQGWLGFIAFAWLMIAVAIGAGARWRTVGMGSVERVAGLFAIAYLARYLLDGLWGDLGGPTTVGSSVLLGVTFWFASGTSAASDEAADPSSGRSLSAHRG